jgi:hypothetical protein
VCGVADLDKQLSGRHDAGALLRNTQDPASRRRAHDHMPRVPRSVRNKATPLAMTMTMTSI